MWAGSTTFDIGGLHIGVRTSSAAVNDLLRAALATYVAEGVAAPANYSLQLTADAYAPGAVAFHLLYRGSTPVVRTLDPHRLLEALFHYLASHGAGESDQNLVVRAVALVGDQGAALAPADIRYLLPTLERRLNAKGVRVVDRPMVRLRAEAAELVLDEVPLDIDRTALTRLSDAVPPPRRPDPPLPSGRYRLVGWGFGVGHGRDTRLSVGEAVSLASLQVLNIARLGHQRALDRLVDALHGMRRTTLWEDKPEELVNQLVALCRP